MTTGNYQQQYETNHEMNKYKNPSRLAHHDYAEFSPQIWAKQLEISCCQPYQEFVLQEHTKEQQYI